MDFLSQLPGRMVGRKGVSLRRLANLDNVPLTDRIVQVAVAATTPFVCRPLHVAHVVEHPKCGGSWVRDNVLSYIGKPRYNAHRLLSKNEVMHGHRLYRRSYHWPIIVVRDPRDMYVSLYHHEFSMRESDETADILEHYTPDPEKDLRGNFAAFLEIRLRRQMHPWFFYSEFLDSWLNRPRICLVRYEDMLADPEVTLIRIVRFLGYDVDRDRIRMAVEENSFANQTKQRYGEARSAGDTDNAKFLRKGVAGDWRNHFNAESCEMLWAYESSSLKRLGYESGPEWIDEFVSGLSSSDSGTKSAHS